MKKLQIKKQTLIELIIAGILLITEVVWLIVYRFTTLNTLDDIYISNDIVLNIYPSHWLLTQLAAIFISIDVFYALGIVLAHIKAEKNTRVFEIFIAALLFVVETSVLIYASKNDLWKDSIYNYYGVSGYLYTRLLAVFVQINLLYIIILEIVHSNNYRLCKTAIAMLLLIIGFLMIWFPSKEVFGIAEYKLSYADEKTFAKILWTTVAIYAIYAVALKIFDLVIHRLSKKVNNADDPAIQN